MGTVIPTLVAIYTAGAHTRGRAMAASALLVAVAVVAAVLEDGSSLNIGGFLFFGAAIAGPFLFGVVIRIRRERERLLVRERDESAHRAVADERTRIARELHDVVAHAISVIVLQARGARHSLRTEPDEAAGAVDAIERTATQALVEMRRLLAILRADDDAPDLAPQPSVQRLDALAREVRNAGLPVDLRVEGEPRELATGVDASAYRIVQEALTNVLKHAGEATARVTVTYCADALELEVVDTGNGGKPAAAGHGLVGMRERAALFGGTLAAERGPEGGYVVRARLPA
jgi:signal transduction histidine kinase